MYALRLLLILAMLGAATASNENSDVCATASAYDGTLSGPSGECDTMIPYVATTMYASDISACSTATIDGGYTEARYTDYAFSACCTDGISACKPDHSSIHTYS